MFSFIIVAIVLLSIQGKRTWTKTRIEDRVTRSRLASDLLCGWHYLDLLILPSPILRF